MCNECNFELQTIELQTNCKPEIAICVKIYHEMQENMDSYFPGWIGTFVQYEWKTLRPLLFV